MIVIGCGLDCDCDWSLLIVIGCDLDCDCDWSLLIVINVRHIVCPWLDTLDSGLIVIYSDCDCDLIVIDCD